ncbi:MAG: GNAT family N-acetyltransferase [Oscillospiraceae bacterium]
MSDMLVKLYEIDKNSCDLSIENLEKESIFIKRAMAPNTTQIMDFIEKTFSKCWADECQKAILNQPSSCYIATKDNKVIGFGCYDATGKAFFGPTGVNPDFRGKGIGKVLLIKCLVSMWEMGYAYAIIGSAGPTKFYEDNCGAIEIPNSDPGFYKDLV